MNVLQILNARHRVVLAQLEQSIAALKVCMDTNTPFYRGEDVRRNHCQRAAANVQHFATRLDEVQRSIEDAETQA